MKKYNTPQLNDNILLRQGLTGTVEMKVGTRSVMALSSISAIFKPFCIVAGFRGWKTFIQRRRRMCIQVVYHQGAQAAVPNSNPASAVRPIMNYLKPGAVIWCPFDTE